jgi:molybdopterin converting factor subunit 1
MKRVTMTIHVRLFAILRERAGISETSLNLPDGATVEQASIVLREKFPAIAGYLSRVAFAVNQNYADRKAGLNDGDELALIPPVSGG